jgi:hypothetical protein
MCDTSVKNATPPTHPAAHKYDTRCIAEPGRVGLRRCNDTMESRAGNVEEYNRQDSADEGKGWRFIAVEETKLGAAEHDAHQRSQGHALPGQVD